MNTLIKSISIMLFFVISFFIVYEISKENAKKPILEIRKTVCFGTCPIYQATVYEDGSVTYDGEKYVSHIGRKNIKLTEGELYDLTKMINELNPDNLENEYDGNITDIPSTFLTFYNDNVIKKVRVRYDFPYNLGQFIDHIHKLIMEKIR